MITPKAAKPSPRMSSFPRERSAIIAFKAGSTPAAKATSMTFCRKRIASGEKRCSEFGVLRDLFTQVFFMLYMVETPTCSNGITSSKRCPIKSWNALVPRSDKPSLKQNTNLPKA